MLLRSTNGRLHGIDLRHVLVHFLVEASRDVTTKELVAWLEANGFEVGGRPGKAVSDALRWEVRRGRAKRRGRGVYAAGPVSRATKWRMAQRMEALRAQVVAPT